MSFSCLVMINRAIEMDNGAGGPKLIRILSIKEKIR